MLILSIDTSTRGCSVSLHLDGNPLATYNLFRDRSSAELLTTLVSTVLEHNNYAPKDLDAIAVAKGPGSYTGLRVAVSTAKGLCYALDKPLIAINTLKAMAAQVVPLASGWDSDEAGILFCPMIDARRMEVFCAVYDLELQEVSATDAVVVDEFSFSGLLAGHRVIFFGDGAEKCRPVLAGHPHALFPEMNVFPSAVTVGELAGAAYVAGEFEELATFEPFYLKDFVGTKPRPR